MMDKDMQWAQDSPHRQALSPLPYSDLALNINVHRRIRNITSIQVRNLTPCATQNGVPCINYPSLPQNKSSGDIDLVLARRGDRRSSTSSRVSLTDEEVDKKAGLSSSRKRTNSRASLRSIPSTSAPPDSQKRVSSTFHPGAALSARQLRTRAASRISLTDGAPLPASPEQQSTVGISNVSPHGIFEDLCTAGNLESTIKSQLMKTFITLSYPPTNYSSYSGHNQDNSAVDRSHRSALAGSVPVPSTPAAGPSTISSSSRLPQSPTRQSGRPTSSRGSVKFPRGSQRPFPNSPPPTPPPPETKAEITPFYMSPIHLPSTNPEFIISMEEELMPDWVDTSSEIICVSLWSCAASHPFPRTSTKGKAVAVNNSDDWICLHKWDLDLAQAEPLPEEFLLEPWRLPLNALLITFSNKRQFWFPSDYQLVISTNHPTSGSHETGQSNVFVNTPGYSFSVEKHDHSHPRRKEVKSANLQDLMKLVTLQACIADNNQLLNEALQKLNSILHQDTLTSMFREASEKELQVQTIRAELDNLNALCEETQRQISERSRKIKDRKLLLERAKLLHEADLESEFAFGARMASERLKHSKLTSELTPTRTSLLSTLSFIFPIELRSPPDLLFTILSVPLPIPLSGSEPAPPLSLSSHPDITEDSVASALGYVALTVQLMATYLSQILTYPVTYIGSRSLIKDPISAMAGPRMFPLYFKGVDTYRFEYAVFLLNKNIEMLMSNRSLRALDMRHTLPNLKNLLLTVTNGEKLQSRPAHLNSIPSGLRTPSSEASSSPPTNPALSVDVSKDPNSASQPSPSATVTRSYLALPSFSRIFKSRQLSSFSHRDSRVTNVEEPHSRDSPTNAEDGSATYDAEDEDDRETIRATPTSLQSGADSSQEQQEKLKLDAPQQLAAVTDVSEGS